MVIKETVAKVKIVVPVPPPVAVKPKTVVVAPKAAVAAVLTPSNAPTTIQTAISAKVKTTSPVVGTAKY